MMYSCDAFQQHLQVFLFINELPACAVRGVTVSVHFVQIGQKMLGEGALQRTNL